MGLLAAILRTASVALILHVALSLGIPFLRDAFYPALLVVRPRPDHLPSPLWTATPARLHDTWGAVRSGGRHHEGIDIFARRGTPVLSTTEGLVLRVGHNNLGGKIVLVLGPGGQRHYYAHLDGYGWVRSGQRVEAGTVLGYVGNTGNAHATPPHLHYGIYAAGRAINPYPLLRGSRGNRASPPSPQENRHL
ncbi:Peptidase family M23 [Noviherbaspirillum humi]|uniref:Peptidase family M23 n=1 Tax=Noviherbaspirillum humi TaxID=1688639 RepID=A0A239JM54_9BURK|nr:M23 family metallopeptidase [Noviherbaspirillum humi]SNT06859.1 Peptidase family M23 [Noviherbaspirillum humi]